MRARDWRLLLVTLSLCGCAPLDTVAVARDAAPGRNWCTEQPPAGFCADFDTSDSNWTQFVIGNGTVAVDGTGSKSSPRALRTEVGGEAETYAALAIGLAPAKPRALRLSFDFLAQELPPEEGGVLLVQVRVFPAEGEAQDWSAQHVELFLQRGVLAIKQIVPAAGGLAERPAWTLSRRWTPGAWTHIDMLVEYSPRESVEVSVDGEPALAKTELAPYVRSGPVNVTLGVVWIQPSRSASLLLDNVRTGVE